jgi:hypothetical protein
MRTGRRTKTFITKIPEIGVGIEPQFVTTGMTEGGFGTMKGRMIGAMPTSIGKGEAEGTAI